jgi:hypothetical protein
MIDRRHTSILDQTLQNPVTVQTLNCQRIKSVLEASETHGPTPYSDLTNSMPGEGTRISEHRD